ncbi:hypothetical protein NC651_008341 [Populus alba x Populus x berolinensis]|nr:hypothetical protein NC651_008341 [Populus alba x Populus x berolinensis]
MNCEREIRFDLLVRLSQNSTAGAHSGDRAVETWLKSEVAAMVLSSVWCVCVCE